MCIVYGFIWDVPRPEKVEVREMSLLQDTVVTTKTGRTQPGSPACSEHEEPVTLEIREEVDKEGTNDTPPLDEGNKMDSEDVEPENNEPENNEPEAVEAKSEAAKSEAMKSEAAKSEASPRFHNCYKLIMD